MKRVLIVDDSKAFLALPEDALATMQYEVAGRASSGREAVQLAESLRPDVILMDIVMPGEIDGIEAARLIRDKLTIPIIFLTGFDEVAFIKRVKDVGAYGYILKPFSIGELEAAIDLALKRLEPEQKYKNLYRDLIENTYDLIHVEDAEGTITFVNRAAIEALGYTNEEIVGKNVKDFLTPQSYLNMISIFSKQVTGQDVASFEMELYDKEGNVRTFENRERLIWDSGRIVEAHGISRDITERKRAEEALHRKDALLSKSEEIAHVGTWELDLLNDLLYWSDEVYRIFGLEPQEFEATYEAFLESVHPEDRRIVDNAYTTSLIQDNTQYEIQHRVVRKHTGEIRIVHEKCEHIRNPSGRIIRSIGMVQDITERRKMEEERERLIGELKEALAKIKTLSGLLPICSHCKKIRDDKGYWNQLEEYISQHTEADFSHSICPDCAKEHYTHYKKKHRGDKKRDQEIP